MKQVKKWTAVLLAAVMLLGLLPGAAMAEEGGVFDGAAEVETFEQFKAALADDEVTAIRITGEVTVDEGSPEQPLEANKPILVATEGKLALAPGAAMASDAPMGQFSYEDLENTWELIAEGMAAFLIWEQNGGTHRLLLGSQPENLTAVLQDTTYGGLSTAVFADDVTLNGDVTVSQFRVVDADLTIEKGVKLTVHRLWAHTVNDLGTLDIDDDGLDCLEYHFPRLAVCWGGDNYDFRIFMMPSDECEVTFAKYDYDDGEWKYTPVGAEDLIVDPSLYYGEVESHEQPTLTAKKAVFGETYVISHKDDSYGVRVHIAYPELGCYSAPAVSTKNYLDKLEYSPLSSNEFYVCISPDAWFMKEEGYVVSDTLTARGVRYSEDGGTPVAGAVKCTKVGDGVWKAAVSDCGLNVEFETTVTGTQDGQEAFEIGTGLWIEPAEQLVYSSAPLTGTDNGWGIPWKDAFPLRDTLSLEAGDSADVRLYLLVYQWEPEGGKPAGWYCEEVNINQIRTEGVSAVQAGGEDDRAVRITAPQSAGTYQVVRLEEKEVADGEYEPIPGSTRGLPLTVSVSSKPATPPQPSTPSPSGGGDSEPTYRISVPVRITGGTVKVTPTSASERQRVTLTVKANSGYELAELAVADSKGKEVALTDKGGGKYTFTMPKGNVSVDAQFQRTAAAVTPPAEPAQTASASPTNDKLEVDGSAQSPAAYKINDYNYFKLRDLAALLNGTGKQFSVGYDSNTGAVTLTSGQPYTPAGSELAGVPDGVRQAAVSTNVVYVNGVSVQLTAYNIDGYNYFKLRDLASALNFSVGWTAERGMFLESGKPYSA